MLHYSGLILVLATWLAGIVLLRSRRGDNLITISKHVSASRKHRVIFASVMTATGIAFFWWLESWVKARLNLGATYTFLVSVTIAFQIGTGLFPDTSGWIRQIHRTFAYGMAILFLPLAALLSISQRLQPVSQFIAVALTGYMLVTFALFVVSRRAHNHYLLFQALYIVAFEVVILVAGYLPIRA
jgi:hypothetical protein